MKWRWTRQTKPLLVVIGNFYSQPKAIKYLTYVILNKRELERKQTQILLD